ncbi:hypothetical protein SESBI_46145 [Sesbania bispinosa]|nr:hypothetical protein SESBI_46145 [Sesbania bispinosa]
MATSDYCIFWNETRKEVRVKINTEYKVATIMTNENFKGLELQSYNKRVS